MLLGGSYLCLMRLDSSRGVELVARVGLVATSQSCIVCKSCILCICIVYTSSVVMYSHVMSRIVMLCVVICSHVVMYSHVRLCHVICLSVSLSVSLSIPSLYVSCISGRGERRLEIGRRRSGARGAPHISRK